MDDGPREGYPSDLLFIVHGGFGEVGDSAIAAQCGFPFRITLPTEKLLFEFDI